MLSRRQFIHQGLMAGVGVTMFPFAQSQESESVIMTVNGPVNPDDLKFTLTHEHILVDFVGAEKITSGRYDVDEVFNKALPLLHAAKDNGCDTFIECTPAYLGRDVRLLQRLSKASGLTIITNTGYYSAVGEKYLPPHAYTETAEQLAARWIKEWKDGIEGTGIRPGFIKTSTDKAPLSPTQRKVIEAAALTHLATGLTIGIHTGDGEAGREQLEILKTHGVSPTARIWIHAQNEKNSDYHIEAANQGSWVSFDGVNAGSSDAHVSFLKSMKRAGLMDHILVSQDSGWYHVGEPDGGNYKGYDFIFTHFIPALRRNDFTQNEINKIFITNPAKAFIVQTRKL